MKLERPNKKSKIVDPSDNRKLMRDISPLWTHYDFNCLIERAKD